PEPEGKGTTAESRVIRLGGEDIPYQVERKKRKTLSICVGREGLLVKAAPKTPVREIETALRGHEGWVLQKLREAARARLPQPEPGAKFPLWGKGYPLVFRRSPGGAAACLRDGAIEISFRGESLCREEAQKALEEYYRQEVRRAAAQALAVLSAQTGLVPAKVTVKKLTASWGRCSSEGNISLSLRLAQFQPRALEYVVLHELCHLRQMNHSAAFWSLVEQYMPDWREARDLLRKPAENAEP
ncbi:MAG: SprT family zinc-dependent metalloprotease, partial [Oscillospiraceae bacterium]|nr:SprT family zinc-dependent metalloprotease [Oscillospiraceae bacterium]